VAYPEKHGHGRGQTAALCLLELVHRPLEVIGTGGRPRWIAYRMTFSNGTRCTWDVSARSDYDTGIFAYNFIRRGEPYGLRIVGSLKSQPALNVLAVYEK